MAGPRKQPTVPLEIAKGILMDETARGARHRWRDGDNVRWLDGLPEVIGGFIEKIVTDEGDGQPRTYKGRARSYHEWDSLDGQNWIAFGTHCKLYLINNDQLYDITPVRRTSSIVDGLSTTSGSAVVTVHDPLHDADVGDHVRFSGASAVGGITLEGEYDVEEIIDLDHYTVRHSAAASATVAGGGGVVTADYDIRCGLETDGTLKGYGTGPYGEGPYGTERENSTYGGFARIWSLDNWGEDLLASPNGETLFVWQRRLGPGSRAKAVSGAPAHIEHMMVGPDDRHVIAFGTNLATGNQQQDKMFVRWCVGDDYEQWLATDTNDAGSKRLDVGSRLITAVKTRQGILIWSDKGLYSLSVVGGQEVYAIQFLGESVKIVSKRAAIDVAGVVYFMGEDDFYVWDGTLQVLPCEISEWVFGTRDTPGIHRVAQSKVQCTYFKEFNEIWWDFPGPESLENNRVAIFNTLERCWYKSSSHARETRGDRNAFMGYPVAMSEGRVWLHENTSNLDGDPMTAFLESYEAEAGEGEFEVLINHLIPDFKRLTGALSVTVFGRDYPQAPRRTEPAGTLTTGVTRLDPRFRARQFGIRVESNELDCDWRMGQWRLIAGPIGAR